MRDIEIAARLRAAGLKVVEEPGWQTRGADRFDPQGLVLHHTAGAARGTVPSLAVCTHGRADLAGPLCHVLIGRDGTCHVIAAGRANHAGAGSWNQLAGNRSVYGIEVENVGTAAEEPWTEELLDITARAAATFPVPTDLICQHKEWAPGRKVDMHTVSGANMRRRVEFHRLPAPTPAPIPLEEDEDMATQLFRTNDGRHWRVEGLQRIAISAEDTLTVAQMGGLQLTILDAHGTAFLMRQTRDLDATPTPTVRIDEQALATALANRIPTSTLDVTALARAVVAELAHQLTT